MIKRIMGLLSAILIVVGVSACAAPAPTTPPTVEILLTAQDIKWDVDRIEAKVGQPIVFVITNEGVLDHNFEISELGVNENIAVGETIELELTFDLPGNYDFVCNVPGHAEAGMVGTITVSE
ncbi:MAG: cupredoxin domain-containing protein [Anaerolineae bacterium]|nr:cupredoxin domain-containing protein [Anaerolineae bacterium]